MVSPFNFKIRMNSCLIPNVSERKPLHHSSGKCDCFLLFVCLPFPSHLVFLLVLYDFRVLLSTFHLIIFYPRKEYIHGKYSCCFVKPLHKSMTTNM